jgi:hypothetical protein
VQVGAFFGLYVTLIKGASALLLLQHNAEQLVAV